MPTTRTWCPQHTQIHESWTYCWQGLTTITIMEPDDPLTVPVSQTTNGTGAEVINATDNIEQDDTDCHPMTVPASQSLWDRICRHCHRTMLLHVSRGQKTKHMNWKQCDQCHVWYHTMSVKLLKSIPASFTCHRC